MAGFTQIKVSCFQSTTLFIFVTYWIYLPDNCFLKCMFLSAWNIFSEIVHFYEERLRGPFYKRKWNIHVHWSDVDMLVTTNINWIGWQKWEKVSSDSFTLKYCIVYLLLHMDFEGTVANALGGEKEVVLRTLTEVGLLQNMAYCNKNHERQQMMPQRDLSRW